MKSLSQIIQWVVIFPLAMLFHVFGWSNASHIAQERIKITQSVEQREFLRQGENYWEWITQTPYGA